MSMRLIVNLSLKRVISSIYFVGNTVILDEHSLHRGWGE